MSRSAARVPTEAPIPPGRRLLRRVRESAERCLRHPSCGLAARAAALVVVAAAIERLLMHAGALPEAAYARPTFLAGPLRVLAGAGVGGIAALSLAALLLVAALRARSPGPAWRDLEHGDRLRMLVGVMAALLAWVFATYDYNFYFDRPHVLERVLLAALVPLVVWRPIFTLPFVAAVLTVGWQFFQPIGGFSWAPASLPVRALILFSAWLLIRLLTRRVGAADLLFVLGCSIAAHYWVSGWEKLRLGWIGLDHPGFLLASTYANGWLGFLEPDALGALVAGVVTLEAPMKAATLLIECGALLMLWRPATVRWFLAAAILLHAAIFALTGIAFWLWSVFDAAVLLLFFRRSAPALPLFDRPHFLLSLVLIGGGALWFRPVPLAWLDARATYTYRLEAVDRDGRSHTLRPAFFAPYDYQFTLGAFRYLVDSPRLPIAWGAVRDRRLTERLNAAGTPERVLALEAEYGRNDHDPARARTFDAFVRRFVGGWQERGGRGRWPDPLQAPATLWTFPRADPPADAPPFRSVIVYEVLSFFDGARYVEIRRTPVRTIPLGRYTPITTLR